VLILVTSYESPLTEDEIRFLRQSASSVRAVFVVVNKQDTVSPNARQEILDYVPKTAHSVLNGGVLKPFSVSARDGLVAKQTKGMEAMRASGILEFEEVLVSFLTAERSELFLSAMFDRVSAALGYLPGTEAERLGSALRELRQKFDESAKDQEKLPASMSVENVRARIDSRGMTPCEICKGVMHQVLEFFRHYQYELSTQPEIQEQHAERGGFCPLHTWHYEQIASPRGVCTAYPRLLNRVAQTLRAMATNGSKQSSGNHPFMNHLCPACQVRWDTEDRLVQSIALKLEKETESQELRLSALCLPHLELLLQQISNSSARQRLLLREAAVMERTAEDMQRYAIKHDALRRYLVSKEENDAPLLGLQLLTGHRNVNAIFTVREIV
jgi:hypothetical protein